MPQAAEIDFGAFCQKCFRWQKITGIDD